MTSALSKPIGIFYEHTEWFRPLFAELERRGALYVRIDAASFAYDPEETDLPYSLVFNRASPSAYRRGNAQVTFFTLDWLRYLERSGVAVVNGSVAYAAEISKANQIGILRSLHLPYPRTVVINSPRTAHSASAKLRFPIVVKANIGGSGAGITRFDSGEDLQAAVAAETVELGIDHVALVQELVPYRGGHITRVEVLGGKFLYAIKVFPAQGSFDLCPADACQTTNGQELIRGACAADAPRNGLTVEAYNPPDEIIEQVERIAREIELDVGGVEYFTDERDGKHYFYDINALSNFVADGVNVIGFDPFEKLVDYLAARAESSVAATALAAGGKR